MSAEALIASYLRIANEDLAGARQLATTGNRNATYLRSIQDLTDYATSYRYPSPKGRIKTPPNKAAFDREANAVQTALQAAAKAFGVDLDKPDAPATSALPVR
jgi:hypothetical protein